MGSKSFTALGPTKPKTAQRPAPRNSTAEPGHRAPTRVDEVLSLQRMIGNRAASRVLAAHAERRLQRYRVLGAADYAINGPNHEFEAQPVAPGAIGLPAPAVPAQIRVSNDGNMAIEHTDLSARQPKVFYATPGVVNAGKAGLAAVQSDYKLYVDRPNAITVTVPGNPPQNLDRVLPQVKRTGTPKPRAPRGPSKTGTTMDVGADCVKVAAAVMKHAGGNRQPRTAHNLPNLAYAEYRMAQYISKLTEERAFRATGGSWLSPAAWRYSAETAALNAVTGGAPLTQPALDAIAISYMTLLQTQPAVAAAVAQELGINVHALPNVGEAYETHRIGTAQPPQTTPGVARPTRHFWGQHIGAVVAASGSDRVTLENYARSHEIGALADDAPHYYFQMYGTGANQSWHEAWTTGAVAAHIPPVGRPSPQDESLTVVVRSG